MQCCRGPTETDGTDRGHTDLLLDHKLRSPLLSLLLPRPLSNTVNRPRLRPRSASYPDFAVEKILSGSNSKVRLGISEIPIHRDAF